MTIVGCATPRFGDTAVETALKRIVLVAHIAVVNHFRSCGSAAVRQICFRMYEPRAAMIGHGRVLLRPSGIASCTVRIANLMLPFATGQFEAHVTPAVT